MKEMLILKASEDIDEAEINNIISQIALYGISSKICKIESIEDLYFSLYSGKKYDYIYLATHGCDTSFGNISGTVNIDWLVFAAMICQSEVAKAGAIFLHSCCRGGLDQVAYRMFGCCNTIELICGPRYNVSSVDLITAFNLFLYNIEAKRIDPVRSADKVLLATDIRLVCFDRLEIIIHPSYKIHCDMLGEEILQAFNNANELRNKLISVKA